MLVIWVDMVYCFVILATIVIVGYQISHLICLLGFYPGISESVGRSGYIWRIQTFVLVVFSPSLHIYTV